MEQFKVLILLIVVTINLNSLASCASNRGMPMTKDHYDLLHMSDTLLLSARDYRIIQSYDHCIKIEVTDKSKQSLINTVKYSVIDIEMMDDRIIAKGNDILSSSVPDGCEYFYAINHKGYIVSSENRITLFKVPKTQYWPVLQNDR